MGCTAFTIVAALFLGYMFFGARAVLRGASCLGNINQVGLSLKMYAEDYDGNLPRFSDWMDKSYPYCKIWVVFHRPEVPADQGFGYALHDGFSQLSKIKHPEKYPLVFDSSDISKKCLWEIRGKNRQAATAPGRIQQDQLCRRALQAYRRRRQVTWRRPEVGTEIGDINERSG